MAALLFDSNARPDASAIAARAAASAAYSVTHVEGAAGWVEVLRDGLTFDLGGLAPAAGAMPEAAAHLIGLPRDYAEQGLAAVSIAPGPHLAGAENLLPVVRVMAALVAELAALPDVRAVAWLPARLAVSAAWFAEAVGVWLTGGPFPVLALTALARSGSTFRSEGLGFFIGQEFELVGRDGVLREIDSRIAVRLTDWLVAHGRVDAGREVVLAGAGAVWLEPDGPGRLVATCR
ncbi:MAG: hypothetical protein RIS94_1374 [Pseudomonadota bacterium]